MIVPSGLSGLYFLYLNYFSQLGANSIKGTFKSGALTYGRGEAGTTNLMRGVIAGCGGALTLNSSF